MTYLNVQNLQREREFQPSSDNSSSESEISNADQQTELSAAARRQQQRGKRSTRRAQLDFSQATYSEIDKNGNQWKGCGSQISSTPFTGTASNEKSADIDS